MTVATDLKKTAAETGYAVVGLTDLAVERVKTAQQRAAALRVELERVEPAEELKKIQTRVQQLPTIAVSAGVEAATKAEATFGDLAVRGKVLVERIREQRSTQELVEQGKQTISRGKAAVTTIRRGAAATVATAEDTVETAEADAAEVAAEVKTAVRKRTQRTRTAAKRTATTARKRTTAAKDQTKAAVNSAKETADVATEAVEESAEKIGD
ncbi:MAG TPA: hypothetical protein VFX33_05965 [Actinomycetales bacterium]|nr:hypothetical protein [Actinomycetales bacterium]